MARLLVVGREGEIAITAEQDEESVRVSIRDTGVGMDEAILYGLFALDRRTCLRGTEGERCSGLGLLMCKEFIEKKMADRFGPKANLDRGCLQFFVAQSPAR